MGGNKRLGFGWKKFAIAAVAIIGLVWVFGPRENVSWKGGWSPATAPGNEEYEIPPDTKIDTPSRPPDNIPQEYPPSPKPPASTHPTSPKDDPDLLKTTHCTHPYTAGAPLVQYALMIDAGSTGSRIHIYKFNNCGPSPGYEYEVFKQKQPGLSSFKGEPAKAAESLDELLEEAASVVPQSLWKCTPVAVKATAGLRLLGTADSEAILRAVRGRLRSHYEFNLRSDDDVIIMDGKDEGVYAWITANYLLNTIRADSPSDSPSYAVLDLGGASTQIVFEPVVNVNKPDSSLKDGEHKYDLAFGGKNRVLYQHSYLGYGLMKARESVNRLVDFLAPEAEATATVITSPCIAQGTEKEVNVTDTHVDAGYRTVTMVGSDVASFDACNRVVQLIMAKDAVCETKPCSFNGVYQPSLLDAFPQGKVLLLSYFYDRINPLLSSSERGSQLKIGTIASLAKDVCLGSSAWKNRWGSNLEAMKELEGRPQWCMDLTFMHSLLRLGYEFTDDRDAIIGKQIEGTELGWCLGATIAMVGADLKCRV